MFYSNQSEKEILEKSKKDLENSGKFNKSIVTKILAFKTFFKAEEYHQNYYKKSSIRYNTYKKLS
jgi:peptide methionine sulfoxide reductase msrA/msrB